ncbi:hypothetical protein SSPO_078640 [Streptomyces antimycoticus]|uniref:Integrase catalytic domain-containing protein n=1 Tax=Streptomyces antimycoticus TaxID=68175 RepID=A0A499VA99_9ACTN|nr:hypothetical protein SSPO_078640 [Streptomyces antimycoticus]
MLTDNAWAYSKNTWQQTCRDLRISPRWTRPWRPQTNGKVERFHRTLLDPTPESAATPQPAASPTCPVSTSKRSSQLAR